MTNTTNLNLVKWDLTDKYSQTDVNNNLDTIDTAVGELQTASTAQAEALTTLNETVAQHTQNIADLWAAVQALQGSETL